MDKRRNRGQSSVAILQDSVLPPSRRAASVTPPPLLDKRRPKKWSIDGFVRKISSILDAQTSSGSSSLDELSKRQKRRLKGKGKDERRAIGYASRREECATGRLRSSDVMPGGPEPRPRNGRSRDNAKARAEALRDRLHDSDERSSGNEGSLPKRSDKRRSRASRTERYLKRMCNSGKSSNGLSNPSSDKEFRPIERVEPNGHERNSPAYTNGNAYSSPCYEQDLVNENFYARHQQQADIGVNPLVQQTLQYFSEFDRNMATSQHKIRKTYPGHNGHTRRRSAHVDGFADAMSRPVVEAHTRSLSNVVPPKPPSRDNRSRILVNGASLDKYQHMIRSVQRPPDHLSLAYGGNKENGCASPRSTVYSPDSCEVSNINGRSPDSPLHRYHLPPRTPLAESINSNAHGRNSYLIERDQSPVIDMNKAKFVDQSPLHFMSSQRSSDFQNSNFVPSKPVEVDKATYKRNSKNLEEALCELEAIYKSLQLEDEDLLDRAERRTMEEFHYKGFISSPDGCFDYENPAARRKTWGDQTSNNCKGEPDVVDRLKDDMAYRRMHPKERPSSCDGQSSLSSISYLMTSPIPSRREEDYIDLTRKPRRKEPDVTLDDVVFRSMQYANNTLKVVEPQPPFGIPLGPITTATDSDYLHTNPSDLSRIRSPYIPNSEPDIVTDDLAFRNLRKDAQMSTSSRQPSPSFLSSNSPSPLPFCARKTRAARSLSANLYGMINKASSLVDSEVSVLNSEVTSRDLNRRTSDPELLLKGSWLKKNLDVNRNKSETRRCSDVELSNRSYDEYEESSDERSRFEKSSLVEDQEAEFKTGSEKGSSYLSSTCSTPPPVPSFESSAKPFTEQEISVYKKLCQDLENLVQMTRGIDAVAASKEPVALPEQKVLVVEDEPGVPKPEVYVPPSITLIPEEKVAVAVVEDSIDKNTDDKACNVAGSSSAKREISTILDNLKSIADESCCSESFCAEKVDEVVEEERKVVIEDKSYKETTKDVCDVAAGHVDDERERLVKDDDDEEADEEEERKDRLDENAFFKNLHLAKLSGDCKESTPVNRRTSLMDNQWEGEIRSSCEQRSVSMMCNASNDMSRLTAKYIFYITNHITAQFCLLLVFFLALLFAIVTVP